MQNPLCLYCGHKGCNNPSCPNYQAKSNKELVSAALAALKWEGGLPPSEGAALAAAEILKECRF